jgi:GH15 family glucan-1,4-alpha-glucosidase
MMEFLVQNAVYDGYFVKKVGSYTVDASLLGLAVPYRMVDIDDQRFKSTLHRIETTLVKCNGVHRYPTDTYYGGGEWILLTGWLGWVYTLCGNTERAKELLMWIESCADEQGNLPEQIPATLNDHNYYQPWLRRWGPIARPLLWSHAKYIILKKHLTSLT